MTVSESYKTFVEGDARLFFRPERKREMLCRQTEIDTFFCSIDLFITS